MGLIVTDYSSVRNLLSVSMTDLSDSVIESDVFLPYVEARVISLVPAWRSLELGDLVILRTCISAWVAGLVSSSISLNQEVTRMKLGDYEYTLSSGGGAVGWDKRSRDCLRLASELLQLLVSPGDGVMIQPMTLAGLTRASSESTTSWLFSTDPLFWSE